MKIYISVDMEGITGVTAAEHVDPSHREYARFRRLMTEDVNAAIEGAIDAGATEFVVNDSHAWMCNVLIEELHPAAELISGSNKPLLQMQGIDESFAAAFFVGYHAMEGASAATINHTIMGRAVTRITVNGVEVGETGINAGTAGHFGVPVALVTGDDKVAQEAKHFLPEVETAVVKEAYDRFVAKSLPPKRSHALIREQAEKAVQNLPGMLPYEVGTPVVMEITFKTTAEAAFCTVFPTVTLVDSKTVRVIGDDYPTAYKQLWGCLVLGSQAARGVL